MNWKILLGTSIVIYYNKEYIRDQYIKKTSNYKAKQIVQKFFTETQQCNPGISLDEVILLFENASNDSLEEFAKNKHRTAESYRQTYSKFYKKSPKK